MWVARVTFLLFLAFLSPSAKADQLIVYLYPSHGISWRTPGALARTAVSSQLGTSRHPIGHVTVEVSCSTSEHFFSGMTSRGNSEERKLLFSGQVGLGVLFHDFKGELERDADIEPELSQLYETGGISFIEYEISPAACERLSRYRREYEERGYGAHYGLPHRPRYGEGGGCSAYAASFLELAGLIPPEVRAAWTRLIHVPERLIGGPLTGRKVSFFRIFFDFLSKWAKAGEGRQLFFWDPDLMYQWANWRHDYPGPGETPLQRGKALGVRIPVAEVPVPDEPIWLKD